MSSSAIIVTVVLFAFNLLQALYTRIVQLSIKGAADEVATKAAAELAAHKLHVAQEYVPFERFDRFAEKVFEKLDKMSARLPRD